MHIQWNLSIKDTLGLKFILITEVSSIQRSLNTLKYYTGTQNGVLIVEVSTFQRSLNTLKYYTGTQNGVLIVEVSTFQRFVIEGFHCKCIGM